MVNFGSCIHEPPRLREVASIERLVAAEQAGSWRVPIPNGRTFALGGASWLVQSGRTDAVVFMPEKQGLSLQTRGDERASFDGPNKLRAELCGAERYQKGEPIHFSATMRVDAGSKLGNADWCIVVQIHQADTKRADGSFVQGSPIFALSLGVGADGRPRLRVSGETSLGVPQPGVFAPTRLLGEAPFSFGTDHRISIDVVDEHGERGRIRVNLDDEIIVDRDDIPVGYAYVDHLATVTDPLQERGSYLKFGVYAGRFTGDRPPDGMAMTIDFREITVAKHR